MSTMRSALCNEVAELFSNRLGIAIPSYETDLFDAGILDSMVFVELLLQIEAACGVKFDLSNVHIEQFRSVEKIAELVAAMNTR